MIECLINTKLQNVLSWANINQLTISHTESQDHVISPSLKKPTPPINIQLNSKQIHTTKTVKYLGLHLDEKLLFQDHINTLEDKISYLIGIMSKLKHYVTHSTLKQIYFAMVHSYVSYAVIIWGSTNKSYFSQLISLQNKAVKILLTLLGTKIQILVTKKKNS